MVHRAPLIFCVVLLTLTASACAAILGIDDVSVRGDSGALNDATSDALFDAPSDPSDGGAFSCSDPNHPHDFCADFEEINALTAFGSDGRTIALNAIVDGGSLSLAMPGNASSGALQVSTDAINPVDASVDESFLVYDGTDIGTTFVLDYDVRTPVNTPSSGGHIDYPILEIDALDGGSALQFYLAVNALQGSEIAAVNTGSTTTPASVISVSTFPDDEKWMHVEMRVALGSSGVATLLAFIGNGTTDPLFKDTMKAMPVQGRVHLQLGLVTSGAPPPQTTLQIDNVTLDTNN